jgi:hypothetical protein
LAHICVGDRPQLLGGSLAKYAPATVLDAEGKPGPLDEVAAKLDVIAPGCDVNFLPAVLD